MKRITQQKILKGLNRVLEDLSIWLRDLGVSESVVVALSDAIALENGIMAAVVRDKISSVFPQGDMVARDSKPTGQVLAHARSSEYGAWLLSQPEPTPQELREFLLMLGDLLPNLREHFQGLSKLGPQRRRGGRKVTISNPETREQIRQDIRRLKGPGKKLLDLDKRISKKYLASPATIKRIRLEKTDE